MNTSYRKHLEEIAVKADSIEDYLDLYYRKERVGDSLIRAYKKEFEKFGYVLTSKHDNITGAMISWLG